MTIANIIVFLLSLAFFLRAFFVFAAATTSMHQIYGGIFAGAGGIIFAIAMLILAIERRAT